VPFINKENLDIKEANEIALKYL